MKSEGINISPVTVRQEIDQYFLSFLSEIKDNLQINSRLIVLVILFIKFIGLFMVYSALTLFFANITLKGNQIREYMLTR